MQILFPGQYLSGDDYYMFFRANREHTINYEEIPEGIFIETEGFVFPFPYITGDDDDC